MKKCPYCAEEIQDEAILCRYCGKSLVPSKTIIDALAIVGGLRTILGILQGLAFVGFLYGAINWNFLILLASAEWLAIFTFAQLLIIGIALLFFKEQTKSSIWSPSFLFGLGIASLLTAYKIAMGDRSLSELILGAITNVLIYTFIFSLIVWIWRKPWGKYLLIGLAIVGLVIGVSGYLGQSSSNSFTPTNTPVVIATYTAPPVQKPTATFYPTLNVATRVAATPIRPTMMVASPPLPLSGNLIEIPEQSTYSSSSDFLEDIKIIDIVDKHATNLAIKNPYRWQFFNLVSSMRYQDIYDYYFSRLSVIGYRVTFNDQGTNGIYLLKLINGGKRVTVQFWEADSGNPPAALVFYEGW